MVVSGGCIFPPVFQTNPLELFSFELVILFFPSGSVSVENQISVIDLVTISPSSGSFIALLVRDRRQISFLN